LEALTRTLLTSSLHKLAEKVKEGKEGKEGRKGASTRISYDL
jgi:hypothetical protein